MSVVHQVWDRAWTSQPASPWWVVAGTGVVAASAVLVPAAWRFTEYASTIAHEGGHTLVAALTGRQVGAVHLHSDHSGRAYSAGPDGWPDILTSAAGYLGPTLFGLAAAAMLAIHHTVGLLWATLILLGLLLARIRNWFGLLLMLVAVALVFCVSWELPIQLQAAAGYLLAWSLLLSAPRDAIALRSLRLRKPDEENDADDLAEMTGLPASVWVWMFIAVTFAAIPVGTYWMLLK